MKTVIVTGSAGLVGSECVRFYASREFRVVGIDNDQRSEFFGPAASTMPLRERLKADFPEYIHVSASVVNSEKLNDTFEDHRGDIVAVIHTAAQPSHDWAASNPHIDFSVNAYGTLNVLETARMHCQKAAAFVFTSTNKVYGDRPNEMRFENLKKRCEPSTWEHDSALASDNGFSETLSIDQSTHSLFGASKLAADILVQEYGRYFGMNTVAFRCGCLTGPGHAGARQHGFLSYLVRCAVRGEPYTVIGYKGKQVRDNLHAADLVEAFDAYIRNPKPGAVYNMGGGRANSCSVREAIAMVEKITGKAMTVRYDDTPRVGDHQWWITDTRKFQLDYPEWRVTRGLEAILREMVDGYTRHETANLP